MNNRDPYGSPLFGDHLQDSGLMHQQLNDHRTMTGPFSFLKQSDSLRAHNCL